MNNQEQAVTNLKEFVHKFAKLVASSILPYLKKLQDEHNAKVDIKPKIDAIITLLGRYEAQEVRLVRETPPTQAVITRIKKEIRGINSLIEHLKREQVEYWEDECAIITRDLFALEQELSAIKLPTKK